MLAYEESSSTREKREIFENNLKEVGLILEKEESQKVRFVKIHVPREVLCQYAEVLKLRMPMKQVCVLQFKKNILVAQIQLSCTCIISLIK